MTDITVYDDLERFGPFEDEWLRGGPVRRWVPKAYADKPIYVFETGGSTGVPPKLVFGAIDAILLRGFRVEAKIPAERRAVVAVRVRSAASGSTHRTALAGTPPAQQQSRPTPLPCSGHGRRHVQLSSLTTAGVLMRCMPAEHVRHQ